MEEREYTINPSNFPDSRGQKDLLMIFVVDTSGSMGNAAGNEGKSRMDEVNKAFEEMIPKLREQQMEQGAEYTLYISIIGFNTTATVLQEPIRIMEYQHKEIACEEWATYYSCAYSMLDEKMSTGAFFAGMKKIASPYIMFMTDGEPTEGDITRANAKLEKLKDNNRFAESEFRYAILIGNEAIHSPEARRAVENFVSGNPVEHIIEARDTSDIAQAIVAKTQHVVATYHRVDVSPVTPPDQKFDPYPGPEPDPELNPGPDPDDFDFEDLY